MTAPCPICRRTAEPGCGVGGDCYGEGYAIVSRERDEARRLAGRLGALALRVSDSVDVVDAGSTETVTTIDDVALWALDAVAMTVPKEWRP